MALDHYAASATAELRNNHRNGKMLIAKTGQESYDSGWLAQNEYASGGTLYNLLDPRVVAQNPSELGTLVCLAKEEKREGHYADGSGAYQLWYHVWLVDFQTKQVIARSHFQGGLPPGTKRGVGGRTGEPPLLELADWLTRLQNGSP